MRCKVAKKESTVASSSADIMLTRAQPAIAAQKERKQKHFWTIIVIEGCKGKRFEDRGRMKKTFYCIHNHFALHSNTLSLPRANEKFSS